MLAVRTLILKFLPHSSRLIAARLDRLPPAERDLVKGLAILGPRSAATRVSAVTTASEREVDDALQALVRKGVLGGRRIGHVVGW